MKIDKSEIRRTVLTELARQGLSRLVPVGISARHVHLTESDIAALFGEGYKLNPIKPLSQPGQFAAREQVTVIGPRGRLEHVRVLGPARKESQVEISVSDSFVLGAKNCPVRLSGDLEGTVGVKLLGPNGQVELKKGLIVAARHLHMNDEQAGAFGIHDKQIVAIRVTGARPCLLENVICRTGSGHELELHLDTDEANSCGLGNGDLAEIVIPDAGMSCGGNPVQSRYAGPGIQPGFAGLGMVQDASGSRNADSMGAAGYMRSDAESSGYVSGNTIPQGYAAQWMRGRGGAGYTGSRNTDAMGEGSRLTGYMSSNAGVLEDNGSGARAAGYVSGNAGVLLGGGSGTNAAGYVSSNADVLGNGRPGVTEHRNIAPSMTPGNAPVPEAWREPTPAQKYAFRPVENIRQVIEVPEEEILELVTEQDINDAYRDNRGQVYCDKKALITPSARDRATAAGIKIIRMKGRE